MFTGLVEALGTVAALTPRADGARLRIDAGALPGDEHGGGGDRPGGMGIAVGDSIAVNGCCLTVVALAGDGLFEADAVSETLARTSLGGLAPGDTVNLERPVRLSDRLGGHLVQGHVDGVGRVAAIGALSDGSARVEIAAEPGVLRYVAEKGSIAVDGVSLTVVGVGSGSFSFALIPHTAAVTTLGRRTVGSAVNLEVDVVAKYVERLLSTAGTA